MGFDCRTIASKLEIEIQNVHLNARSTHTTVDASEMEASGTLYIVVIEEFLCSVEGPLASA